jgi:hypothetical protein
MPAVKNIGEPCAGEPHARLEGRREQTRPVGYAVRPRRLPPTLPLPWLQVRYQTNRKSKVRNSTRKVFGKHVYNTRESYSWQYKQNINEAGQVK